MNKFNELKVTATIRKLRDDQLMDDIGMTHYKVYVKHGSNMRQFWFSVGSAIKEFDREDFLYSIASDYLTAMEYDYSDRGIDTLQQFMEDFGYEVTALNECNKMLRALQKNRDKIDDLLISAGSEDVKQEVLDYIEWTDWAAQSSK